MHPGSNPQGAGATVALAAGANFTDTAKADFGGVASTPDLDLAVLNFALNLEYLEAEYYLHGLYGSGLEAHGAGVTDAGVLGPVLIEPDSQVRFETEAIFLYAQESGPRRT